MTNTFDDLKKPIDVSFERIFIDPNNPRIAEDHATRYEKPEKIFDPELQKRLSDHTYDIYKAKELHDSIIAQGWAPIDGIIVWEHPDQPKHYIVVEGNTRISVLRRVRESTIKREQAKLERLKKSGRVPEEDVRQQEMLVSKLETIISDTEKLRVFPVKAPTAKDLERVLPRLLGVRHFTNAKQWRPYEQNLYMTNLYKRLFYERHGTQEILRLEQDLIDRVAEQMSIGPTKTRRSIQAASAYQHFTSQFEDQLPEGDKFVSEDHYFFELILMNKYAQDEFEFAKDMLRLPDESEDALFKWAFEKSRQNKEVPNENIFRKAEDIRLWSRMKRYDDMTGTIFASQFDVRDPESAKPMSQVEADYLAHKNMRTPLETLGNLLQSLKDLKVDTMITQAKMLEPALDQIKETVGQYLKMIKAGHINEKSGTKS